MWISYEFFMQGTEELLKDIDGIISVKELIVSAENKPNNRYMVYFSDGMNVKPIFTGYKDSQTSIHIPLKSPIQAWPGAWLECFNGGQGCLYINVNYEIIDNKQVKNLIKIDNFVKVKQDGKEVNIDAD
jgi:hypothetical protein